MRIILCDDRVKDEQYRADFREEWGLDRDDVEVLYAYDDAEVLKHLGEGGSADLLILDLLWDDQSQSRSTRPMGLEYLERIRVHHPELRVVTRSVTEDVGALAQWVGRIIELGVSDHFVAFGTGPEEDLRRRILLDSIESSSMLQAINNHVSKSQANRQ